MKMNVIVFGAGMVGKKCLPYLEEQYHIQAVIDNNEKLWGTRFGSYIIEEPSKNIDTKSDVIITSSKYAMEIVEQLINMEVKEERIYICYQNRAKEGMICGVYSIIEEKLDSTSVSLIQYDLLHRKEQENGKKKILLFCSFFTPYVKQLIENMSKRYEDIELSLLTNAYESKELIQSDKLMHIYCYETMEDIKSILEKIPVYDVIQLLWMEREWVFFTKLIRKKAKRLNIKVGGSDFYRSTVAEKEYKKRLISCADVITADTECTANNFVSYFQENTKDKIRVLPYGAEVLDYIKRKRDVSKDDIRERFRICKDKKIVTCGHNANKEHQHLKMVDALVQLPDLMKKQIVCVFPMAYGVKDAEYEKEIVQRLNQAGIEVVILKEYMNFEYMAEYAMISDIMIHVQTTDQLSSSMLEEMYAGSIIIAGQWLPYQNLRDKGIYFIDVNEIETLTEVIEDVIEHIDEYKCRCERNRELVWEHSSWDTLAERWYSIWK